MKGFMFSIEATLAIGAVLLMLGATAFITEQKQVSDNYGQIKTQSEISNTLHFNKTPPAVSPISKEKYCEKVFYFNKTASLISEKDFCMVIK